MIPKQSHPEHRPATKQDATGPDSIPSLQSVVAAGTASAPSLPVHRPLPVGSFAWMQATHGRLTWPERLTLLRHALMPNLTGMWRTWTGRGLHQTVDLESLALPDTAAVRHALEEAECTVSGGVFQHSMRTYFWAAALATIDRLSIDPEFMLVTSALHDLAISDKVHRPGCDCFAGQSAYAARDIMLRFGWPQDEAERLADAISLHMNGHSEWREGLDPEARLLQQGAAFDVIGARWHDVDAGFKEQVLLRHPRLGFDREFADFIASEGRRRPRSRAALMQAAGLPLMIKLNPFKG